MSNAEAGVDALALPIVGENEGEQMQCVMEVLGPPPASLLEKATRKEQFFEGDGSPRITPNKAGLRRFPATRDLPQALRCNDAPFISFLQVLLHSCCYCACLAVADAAASAVQLHLRQEY